MLGGKKENRSIYEWREGRKKKESEERRKDRKIEGIVKAKKKM